MSARPLISDLHSAPCSLLLAPCSLEQPAIRRAGAAEPSNAPHKLRPGACIAILAGILLSVEHPTLIGESFEKAGLNLGTGYALVCALFWGLSTVAGRGTMIGMPLRLAASMRVVVGLICITFILLMYGKLNRVSLWPPAAQAHITTAIVALLLLASI